MKSKGLDNGGGGGQVISPPGGGGQETQSLCGSPSYRYGRPSVHNEELLASQKQQILARFGHNLPGFGFTQSKNSCLFEDEEEPPVNCYSNYTYRHGNQLEYIRLEELDVVQHQRQRLLMEPSSCRQDPPATTLLLLPTFVRSAESLVVLSKEHLTKERVDAAGNASADRRLNNGRE